MQVRCPRCGSVAPVEPGRMPVCPGCGFSGGPLEGPGLPPAQPTEYIEAPMPTSTKRADPMRPKRRVSAGMIVLMILLVLLLAGAVGLAVAYDRGIIEWNPYP